jgi:leader peptidase (prepilin peptidase)/N-methyltransferase
MIDLPAYLIVWTLGAAIGSFLNVVIYRIPAHLSVFWPPSRCPKCLHQLKVYDNVPVLGWLWLKGRCRYCHTPISSRYPIVEGVMGFLFLLIFSVSGLTWQTVGFWIFFSWLFALAMIDLDTMTLPNILTQSGLVVGLGFQVIEAGFTDFNHVAIIKALMGGILGAVLGLWLFDIIGFVGSIIFGQTAMGGGDPKLAAMMGAWLGWKYLLLAGFLACALGAFVGGGAIALGWLDRRQPMPFGPFLALGAGITALCGEMILSTYLHLFFPTIH